MDHQNPDEKKDRLNLLRKQANELKKELIEKRLIEDLETIDKNHLALNLGHLDRAREIARQKNISLHLAAKDLRSQIMHDDLDFTLPFPEISRLKKIISLVNRISIEKTWRSDFQHLLEDGNEELLLDTLEQISWESFYAKKTLSSYCYKIQYLPRRKDEP